MSEALKTNIINELRSSGPMTAGQLHMRAVKTSEESANFAGILNDMAEEGTVHRSMSAAQRQYLYSVPTTTPQKQRVAA